MFVEKGYELSNNLKLKTFQIQKQKIFGHYNLGMNR